MPFKPESLKELREKLGMSLEEMAFAISEASRLLGSEKSYTDATLRNYERGRTVPTVNILDSLEVIAKYFDHDHIVFYEKPN